MFDFDEFLCCESVGMGECSHRSILDFDVKNKKDLLADR